MEIIANCEESRGLGGMLVTPVGPRCRDRNAGALTGSAFPGSPHRDPRPRRSCAPLRNPPIMYISRSFPRRVGTPEPCGGARTVRGYNNHSQGFIWLAEFRSGGALFKAASSSSAQRRGGTTALQHLPRRRAGVDPRASSPSAPPCPRTAPSRRRPRPRAPPTAPGRPRQRGERSGPPAATAPPSPAAAPGRPRPRAGREGRSAAPPPSPPVPTAPAALPQRARAFVLQSIPAAGGGSASTTAGAGGERGGALCGRKGHLGSSSRARSPDKDHYLAARMGSPTALPRQPLGQAGIAAVFPRPSTASSLAEGRRHRQCPPPRLPSIVVPRPAPRLYLQCGAGASIPRDSAMLLRQGGTQGGVCGVNE